MGSFNYLHVLGLFVVMSICRVLGWFILVPAMCVAMGGAILVDFGDDLQTTARRILTEKEKGCPPKMEKFWLTLALFILIAAMTAGWALFFLLVLGFFG